MWTEITADAALVVMHGREIIFLDRLPRPVTLLLSNASAIEARSDATGTGAAEGESAVPEGQTPTPSKDTPDAD